MRQLIIGPLTFSLLLFVFYSGLQASCPDTVIISSSNCMPMCSSSATTLSSTIYGNPQDFTFSWDFPNGGNLSGVGLNQIQSAESGLYKVFVDDGNGCTAVGTFTMTVNTNGASGVTYSPTYYWKMDQPGSTPTVCQPDPNTCFCYDVIDNKLLGQCKFNTPFYYNTDGLVSDCVMLHDPSASSPEEIFLNYNDPTTNQTAITYEFAILIEAYQLTVDHIRIFEIPANSDAPISLYLNMEELSASVRYNDNNGLQIKTLNIKLDGIGRKNAAYYFDNDWHHFALRVDLTTDEFKLWVDGESPDGFSVDLPQAVTLPDYHQPSGNNGDYRVKISFPGRIDELAIWHDQALPETMIYQHYLDLFSGSHYSTTDVIAPCDLPCPQSIVGSLDPTDFPIGYDPNCDGEDGSNAPDPIDQIMASPSPRYKPDHALRRNFPWFEYKSLVDQNVNTTDPVQVATALSLQEEMVKHWGYMLRTTFANDGDYGPALITQANDFPEIPLGHISLWALARPQNLHPGLFEKAMISQQMLTEPHYFLNDGDTLTDMFSLATPLNVIEIDGQAALATLNPILDLLDRPVDLINENGEVEPVLAFFDANYSDLGNTTLLTKNPGIPFANNVDTDATFESWASGQKTLIRKAYRDNLLDDPRLQHTEFTWYAIDGAGGTSGATDGDLDGTPVGVWDDLKDVSSILSPGSNYYGTPDYYPSSPIGFANTNGFRHGLDWILKARKSELESDDSLYSPYVSPGYTHNPTKHLRPGQYLGLLKVLSVMGGEFYYTGFFPETEEGTIPPQDPRHWAWQVLMPGYAQAVTSRFEEVLFQGEIWEPSAGKYQFFVPNLEGSPLVRIAARKFDNTDGSTYLFSGTLQKTTNMTGSLVSQVETDASFEGYDGLGEIKTNFRRQGSTYMFNIPNQVDEEAQFYQLDGWHESTHPSRWSEDYHFEAEVYDRIHQLVTDAADHPYFVDIRTEVPGSLATAPPSKTGNNDFTDFTSFLSFENLQSTTSLQQWKPSKAPYFEYQFRPRYDAANPNFNYQLYLKARKNDIHPDPNTGAYVMLLDEDGEMIMSEFMGCINNSAWAWYWEGSCGGVNFQNLTEGANYTLRIIPQNALLELDAIHIDAGNDFTSSLLAPACNFSFTPICDFELLSFCQEEVRAVNRSVPFGLPCLPNFRWSWSFDATASGYANNGNTGVGAGSLNGNPYPNISGTFENPTYQYTAPGNYYVTARMYDATSYLANAVHPVTVHPAVNVTASTTTPGICYGPNGKLKALASGGLAPYKYAWSPSQNINDPSIYNPEVVEPLPGIHNFTVEVTDKNGCKASSDTKIKVHTYQNPAVGVRNDYYPTKNSIKICDSVNGAPYLGGSPYETFNAGITQGSTAPYTFEWTPNYYLSTPTLSANGTVSTVTAGSNSSMETVLYTVKVTDADGCIAKGNALLYVEGIDCSNTFKTLEATQSDPEAMMVFPNPTEGGLTVLHQHPGATILVWDANGRQVQMLEGVGEQVELMLDNLSSGIYMIELRDGEHRETTRIQLSR